MAYSKQNFQDGQILNAANLEAMENGIIAGQGAHNLLDNSDFSNPVNSRGKNTYSDEGNEYTIDRWKTKYKSNISIENGYINIFGRFGLDQYIQNPKDGIYTFAARVRINSSKYGPVIYVDDNSGSSNDLFLDANIGEWKTYILQHDFSSTTSETITFAFSLRGGDTTASISVEWAAMYKGAYTADTLPPYIPKGKHVEMLNCGVPLQPHNLLDNSDFRNPVNQLGRSGTYEGVSNYTTFVIDRWKTWSTGCTYTLSSAGLQIANLNASSSAGPWEVLPNPERMKGKTYTLAVWYNGGNVACGNVAVPTGTLTEDKYLSAVSTLETRPGVRFVIASTYSSIDFQILISAGQTVTIERAALYEGSYTTDTLPDYVPKGKHVEMINCGVPLAPHNLLDNSNFRNPVNQRGAAEATMGKYFIDRWKVEPFSSGPSITINSNGLTLLPTTSSTAGIYQTLPDYENRKGKVHTFAICVDNVWECVSFTMGNFGVGYRIHGLDFFSTDSRHILIRNTSSDNPSPITIQHVALYEGAYDASTLPAYQPKGFAAELAECQRYYKKIRINVAYSYNNIFTASFPINMRITPTVNLIKFDAYGKAIVSDMTGCALERNANEILYAGLPTCLDYQVGGLSMELSADL